MTNRIFGRIESPDMRDDLFPVSTLLPETNFITEKYWYPDGWWGDQGNSPHCTAYSWLHWLEDGPVIHDFDPKRAKPMIEPKAFYDANRNRDGIPGLNYLGSTVRGGAKVLKELNVISEYRWASNINEVVSSLINLGPVVVGTRWFENMNKPDSKGIINIGGNANGGHAYLLNGVDFNKGYIRIKNSWSKNWGVKGHAFIRIEDFEKLLKNKGEACIAMENKLRESVNINRLKVVTD